MADQTGIEPAIFSVTGRHVNRYTTDPYWLQGKDLNLRPSGYGPDELPTALPCDVACLRIITLIQDIMQVFFLKISVYFFNLFKVFFLLKYYFTDVFINKRLSLTRKGLHSLLQ